MLLFSFISISSHVLCLNVIQQHFNNILRKPTFHIMCHKVWINNLKYVYFKQEHIVTSNLHVLRLILEVYNNDSL